MADADPPIFCPSTGVRVLWDATALRVFCEDPVTYWLSLNQGWRFTGDNPRFIWGHLREWVELELRKWKVEHDLTAVEAKHSMREALTEHNDDFVRLQNCEELVYQNRMTADRLLEATDAWIDAFWERIPGADWHATVEQKFIRPLQIWSPGATQIFTSGSFDAIVPDPLGEGRQEVDEFKASSTRVSSFKLQEYERSIQGRMYKWMAGAVGIDTVRWSIWDISGPHPKFQWHPTAVHPHRNFEFERWMETTIRHAIQFEEKIIGHEYKLDRWLSIPTVPRDWRDLLVNHDPGDWGELLNENCTKGPAWDPLRRSG